jgi:osmotically-inducible protein OsmY
MMKKVYALLALVLAVPALHGCFPAMVAGGGAAVMMADDRRSTGTILDDQGIETKAKSRIKETYGDQVHFDVTSFNRFVLLTGEVPSEQVKSAIGTMAAGIPNVRSVQNELQVAPVTSTSTRANDAYLTSKVKARFVGQSKFKPNHVKVVTENSVVYLMGLVSREEGDAAAEIASTTGGVLRVVKVFEYTE